MLSNSVKATLAKQEMAEDLKLRRPLIASPFNPVSQQDRKDLDHATI